MKNVIPPSVPIEKIYEVISSETRKFEIRRKLSATQDKKQETVENTNLLIENTRDKLSVKPSDTSFQEE